MVSVRYYLTRISTRNDPMNGIGSSGYLEVEDQGSSEATDHAAYLRATSEPGQLLELVRVREKVTVWCEGMPIPGLKITGDMVGMTFAEAIKFSMSK